MESFNKNWLAILLIAIVFSALGFLFGRITAHPPLHDRMMYFNRPMGHDLEPGDSLQVDIEVEPGGPEGGPVILRMDSAPKNVKKVIVREIRRDKK